MAEPPRKVRRTSESLVAAKLGPSFGKDGDFTVAVEESAWWRWHLGMVSLALGQSKHEWTVTLSESRKAGAFSPTPWFVVRLPLWVLCRAPLPSGAEGSDAKGSRTEFKVWSQLLSAWSEAAQCQECFRLVISDTQYSIIFNNSFRSVVWETFAFAHEVL